MQYKGFQLLQTHKAMANVRDEQVKRAQLVALLKVQERVKQCDRDRYGNVKFKLTDQDIADICGRSVDWVRKYRKIIKTDMNESDEK